MKKVVAAVIILSIILAAGILEAVYIDKVFEDLNCDLIALSDMLKSENPASLVTLDDITTRWEKKRKFIELFAYSQDLRSFSIALGEARGSIEKGDFDNALSKCESLIVMAKNIHNVLDFNVSDVI